MIVVKDQRLPGSFLHKRKYPGYEVVICSQNCIILFLQYWTHSWELISVFYRSLANVFLNDLITLYYLSGSYCIHIVLSLRRLFLAKSSSSMHAIEKGRLSLFCYCSFLWICWIIWLKLFVIDFSNSVNLPSMLLKRSAIFTLLSSFPTSSLPSFPSSDVLFCRFSNFVLLFPGS